MYFLKSFLLAIILGPIAGFIVIALMGMGGYEDWSFVLIIPVVSFLVWMLIWYFFEKVKISNKFALLSIGSLYLIVFILFKSRFLNSF